MNEEKKQIKKINQLINDEEFLRDLCAFFNNNEENVDKILSLIIVYYLDTLDQNFDYTIEELIKNVNRKYVQKYLFAQVDSSTDKKIKLIGITNSTTEGELPPNLVEVARALSFDPVPLKETLLFTTNPYKAISDLKPSVLFTKILQEPNGKEKPITVTEPEIKHYTSILNEHIFMVTKEQTGAVYTEGKKILNKYIDTKRHLIVVPSDHRSIDFGRTVGTYESLGNISPMSIGHIEAPSTYHLKQICLEQNPPRVAKKVPRTTSKRKNHLVEYYRFEPVAITDQFEYFNKDVTGDADYDIDILYKGLKSREEKENVSSIFDENLIRIKKSTELIQLSKHGNRYEIINGRHRLVYLKHMYKRMTDPKMSGHFKDEDFMIPAMVNYGIENEDCNNLLLTIKNRHKSAKFLKDNINDDKENIIIIIDNKVYRVGNLEELKEFVYSLHQEKYFIGTNTPLEIDYEHIINKIIYSLKGNYKNLSFFDITKIIKEQGIDYHGTLIKTNSLDYFALHRTYLYVIANLERNKTFYEDMDVLKELKKKIINFDLASDIENFVENYPKNLELNPFELVNLLKEDERFTKYDDETIRDIVRGFKINALIYERNKRIRNNPNL